MGAVFGLLGQRMRDERGTLGRAIGVNGLGATIAPLVTAQMFIPAFGALAAVFPVALAYLLLMPTRRVAILAAAAPVALAAILLMKPISVMVQVPPGDTLLAVREGPMATASVVSDAQGTRYLEVNGRFRMGGTSSMRSDYRQAMLPLLLHPQPKTALFLGLGTGATLIGGTKMPGLSAEGVELLPEVVELLPWFVSRADLARAPITVADARRFIVADTKTYDVVIADLFHPALDGSGALYTMEHFAAVHRRLAPGGIFCQWLPLYQLDAPSLKAIIRSFRAVYPGASAWLNHYSVGTPMLALIGPRDGVGMINPSALQARLGDPATRVVVQPVGFESPVDLLGQYLAGPNALARFAGDGPRNTDDYPFVTFDARRNVEALSAPPWTLLLDVIHGIRADPAELLEASPNADQVRRLTAYWAARDRFLEAGASLKGEPRGMALIAAAAPGLIETLRLSPEFDPAYRPLLAMVGALLNAHETAAARRLVTDITNAAPYRIEAQQLRERLGD
jgi:spermidine synthase